MTILTAITTAPTAPSRDDPTNFRTRADAYVDWQSGNMVPEINDIVDTLNDAMPDLWRGTSTTSMTIGTGSKSFTVAETLLFFGVGTTVRISQTTSPMVNYMNGVVTAYNGSTGAMTVSVSTSEGSGTIANWTITPEVPIPLLGTVATYDVTTSATDTTADRILKMGDHGLGAAIPTGFATAAELNASRPPGFYRADLVAGERATLGLPAGTDQFWSVIDVRNISNTRTQLLIDAASSTTAPRMFFRKTADYTSDTTNWGAFVEIYHTGNQRYTVVDANTTMVAHRPYAVNTSAAARTMTLPATATAGDWVEIVDAAGTFHTYNCTISRNSHNIMGLAENLIADEQNAAFKLVYVDATYGWRLG